MIFDDVDRRIKAIDFLMYSYFGVNKADASEQIIEAVIKRAYRDAASHVLSFKKGKEDETNIPEKERENAKDSAKDEAISEIKGYVKQLKENKLEDYDKDFHRELCRRLVEIYSKYKNYQQKEKDFTVGIAQKWVNMSMKYIYLLYYLLEHTCGGTHEFSHEYMEMIVQHKHSFHVPLDRYMYEAVEKKLGIKRMSQAWSRITDYKEYFKYQQEIRTQHSLRRNSKSESPIDWESVAWLEVAQGERKHL